eukprot:133623-Pleurochrysis_carterae.AAC.3
MHHHQQFARTRHALTRAPKHLREQHRRLHLLRRRLLRRGTRGHRRAGLLRLRRKASHRFDCSREARSSDRAWGSRRTEAFREVEFARRRNRT